MVEYRRRVCGLAVVLAALCCGALLSADRVGAIDDGPERVVLTHAHRLGANTTARVEPFGLAPITLDTRRPQPSFAPVIACDNCLSTLSHVSLLRGRAPPT